MNAMNAFYSNAFVRRRCDGSRHGPGFFTLQMNEFEPDFSSSTRYDDLQPGGLRHACGLSEVVLLPGVGLFSVCFSLQD